MVVEKANARPVDFSFVTLKHGVQLRIGDRVKNVMFYGPGTVRVNTTLGKIHTTQPSLTVVAKPPVPDFQVEDGDSKLRITSAELLIDIDKKSGALTFLRPDGTVITRENADQPAELKEVDNLGCADL